MSSIGILVAMVLFLVMVYKNCVSYWVAILCTIIVALTNDLDILSALFTLGGEQSSFLQGMVDLLPTMFKVVFMGAIIGKLYTDSGAVTSIANALIRAFVEKRQGPSKITAAVIVIAVLNCLLTLGGIDGYVLTFTMVPICLAVCQQCNIPRRFIGGFMTLNCAFMVFPGSPQIYNVMGVTGAQAFAGGAGLNPTELGISSTMGMIPGVVASIIIAVLSVITMIIVSKRAVARGEGFDAQVTEGERSRRLPAPRRNFDQLQRLFTAGGVAVFQLEGRFAEAELRSGFAVNPDRADQLPAEVVAPRCVLLRGQPERRQRVARRIAARQRRLEVNAVARRLPAEGRKGENSRQKFPVGTGFHPQKQRPLPFGMEAEHAVALHRCRQRSPVERGGKSAACAEQELLRPDPPAEPADRRGAPEAAGVADIQFHERDFAAHLLQ